MNFDQLVARALARPHRNIFADLGPRCPTCSGMGMHFKPTLGEPGRLLSHPSRCTPCENTGLDVQRIERMDREALWAQINKIESKLGMKLTSRYKYPKIVDSRQYFMETIYWATADGTAVSNTTTETILSPNVTIPAFYMNDGRALRVTATGKYSTASATPGVNFIWGFRWGGVAGTLITKSGALVTPTTTALSNGLWFVEIILQTRSNGSAGTLMGNGKVELHDTTAQTMRSATNVGAFGPITNGGQSTPAVATLDFTSDTAFSFTTTQSAASGSNTQTLLTYHIESLN